MRPQATSTLSTAETGTDASEWDVKGIWNATQAWGLNTYEAINRYYVASINSLALCAEGVVIDPVGFGAKDIANRILRVNDPSAFLATRDIRRFAFIAFRCMYYAAAHDLRPTEETESFIRDRLGDWGDLPHDSKARRIKCLSSKCESQGMHPADILQRFGWHSCIPDLNRFS